MSPESKHRRLPDNRNYFRLLELLPGSSVEESLVCRLRTEKISSSPSYEAISYVWRKFDDERDHAIVQCEEGYTINITYNLQSVLKSIRAQGDSQLLWADAICIDQDDLEERTEQVQRMKDIFENAAKVIVWLGSNITFRAPDLFSFLDRVAKLCPCPETYGVESSEDFQPLDQYLKDAGDHDWEMLRELHNCVLFKRIWVIQEFNLAAEGYLLAGHHRLRIFNFKTAMFWIRKRRPSSVKRFRIPWENLDPFIYLRFVAGDTSRPPASITGSSTSQHVYFVLRCVRNCSSTDPRDTIYGLLGHSSLGPWARPIPGYTQVPVDYKSSHTKLYFAVACRLMEESQPMFTLSLVEHDESIWKQENPDCPSWVPRWDLDRCNYILADEYRDRYEKRRTRPSAYKISKRVLEVEGCCVDTVSWRSQTMTLANFQVGFPGIQGQGSIIKEAWEHIRNTCNVMQSNFAEREEEKLLTDFCLTLNGDCRILSKQTYRDNVTIDQRIADCLSVLDDLQAPIHNRSYLKARWGGGSPDRFLATSESLSRGRCFFLTTGGLMGLGPRVASVGDVVSILFGAQVPFLLEPVLVSKEEYRLCGECYVHGMMNGEAIEAVEKGLHDEKLIRLV